MKEIDIGSLVEMPGNLRGTVSEAMNEADNPAQRVWKVRWGAYSSCWAGRDLLLVRKPPLPFPEHPDADDLVEVLLDGSTVGFVRRMRNRRWSVAPAILRHSVFGVHPTLNAYLDAAQVADAIRSGWRDKEADLFVRVCGLQELEGFVVANMGVYSSCWSS